MVAACHEWMEEKDPNLPKELCSLSFVSLGIFLPIVLLSCAQRNLQGYRNSRLLLFPVAMHVVGKAGLKPRSWPGEYQALKEGYFVFLWRVLT